MKRVRPFGWGDLTTIRVRLGAALAAALLPVLVLGAVQTVLAFRREADERQAGLLAAAERGAVTARARIEAAGVLLETLAPVSAGPGCEARLAEVTRRVPGYLNLIRFDEEGAVVCAAGAAPDDPQRADRSWFAELAAGRARVITAAPGALYANRPTLLTATPVADSRGRPAGAIAAVIDLRSLRPAPGDPLLPSDAEVALVAPDGHYLSVTRSDAFADRAPARPHHGSVMIEGRDRSGQSRIFAVAPLTQEGVAIALSTPSQGLVSWAWVNPLSRLALPILAFAMALVAVLVVAERGVVRWIAYLQRIAAIYARGRFSVRPIQAEQAPPEIRDLGETLDVMARTIMARDAALRDSITHKDALMREIHHRVKNNLQIIGSLLNLQQRALTDVAARAAISDTRQRINALALIYRALYEGPDLQRVDLRSFLEDLTGQIISDGFGGPATRTELDIQSVEFDPDKLAPLALFAVEAITHARNHGLGGSAGLLQISFKAEGGEARLAFASDAGGETSEGVGRTLMTAFARQLRGTFSLEPNDLGGVTTQLVFPLPQASL